MINFLKKSNHEKECIWRIKNTILSCFSAFLKKEKGNELKDWFYRQMIQNHFHGGILSTRQIFVFYVFDLILKMSYDQTHLIEDNDDLPCQ